MLSSFLALSLPVAFGIVPPGTCVANEQFDNARLFQLLSEIAQIGNNQHRVLVGTSRYEAGSIGTFTVPVLQTCTATDDPAYVTTSTPAESLTHHFSFVTPNPYCKDPRFPPNALMSGVLSLVKTSSTTGNIVADIPFNTTEPCAQWTGCERKCHYWNTTSKQWSSDHLTSSYEQVTSGYMQCKTQTEGLSIAVLGVMHPPTLLASLPVNNSYVNAFPSSIKLTFDQLFQLGSPDPSFMLSSLTKGVTREMGALSTIKSSINFVPVNYTIETNLPADISSAVDRNEQGLWTYALPTGAFVSHYSLPSDASTLRFFLGSSLTAAW